MKHSVSRVLIYLQARTYDLLVNTHTTQSDFAEEGDDDFQAKADVYNFRITCDNEVKVYVDGDLIKLKRPRRFDWRNLDHFSAGSTPRSLAVKCSNLKGIGGILLSGKRQYENGTELTVASNEQWR